MLFVDQNEQKKTRSKNQYLYINLLFFWNFPRDQNFINLVELRAAKCPSTARGLCILRKNTEKSPLWIDLAKMIRPFS